MSGYNFEYSGYAKFEAPVNKVFVEEVAAQFMNQLDESTRQSLMVIGEERQGFALFIVKSQGSFDYDSMYDVLDDFKHHLAAKGAYFIGFIHYYDRTIDDIQHFEDAEYEEYIETAEEEKEKLCELLLQSNIIAMAHACLQALEYGHIEFFTDGNAEEWVNEFREFGDGLYIENEHLPHAIKLQQRFDTIYEQIVDILIEGFTQQVEDNAGNIIALDSSYTMGEIFDELWIHHGHKLQRLMEQLLEIAEIALNDEIDIEEIKEEVLQYYEAAGFTNFQAKLAQMSDEEIKVLYEETFE
ncbi:MAG: hypothetical protein ABS882_13500 [Lysinibacillus sp.]